MYFLLESNIRLKTVDDIELDYNGHIIYIQYTISNQKLFYIYSTCIYIVYLLTTHLTCIMG